MRWYQTSLGKKYIMGVSGLLMVGFVIAHMLGNMSIFWGAAGINAYAEHLRALPPLLWAFRAVMLLAFLLHLFTGISLYLENKAARPISYVQKKNQITSFAAENMIWTGLILGAFVIYHIMHFTLHTFNPEFHHMMETGAERFNVFAMVVGSFKHFAISFVYVAAMVVLLLHLYHGAQSFFQSLGWTNDQVMDPIEKGGRLAAAVVAIGFVIVPMLIYFHAIGG